MQKLKQVCTILALYTVTTLPLFAQSVTTLVDFDSVNGANPGYGSLVQGFDGNLYGTTMIGGACDGGSVFGVTTDGKLKVIYSFCSNDRPRRGLTLGRDGSFYGTTSGIYRCCGTIFKITARGVITTLAGFYSGDNTAAFPSGVIQASDGDLYGTTEYGGDYEFGSVFRISSKYALTTLYSFCGNTDICSTDGNGFGGGAELVEANGKLYGVTAAGPDRTGVGTVFTITPQGVLTTIYYFVGVDGSGPSAALVQGANSNLYGTTPRGGRGLGGTVFVITPRGILATLYNFCQQTNCADGGNPTAALVLGTDGNFYGTTFGGGANGLGTIFKISPQGAFAVVHSFTSAEGAGPYGGLVQGTDGNFYGTTYERGAFGYGTVFKLSMGLGPFVKTQITSGKVGTKVVILGTNLTGASSVTFGGVTATFAVVSSSEITTSVPPGANTGKVQVTTPNGTLISDKVFRVKP